MGKIVDRMMDFFGVGEPFEEDRLNEEPREIQGQSKQDELASFKKGKVLSLHTTKNLRVVVVEPSSFEESQVIAEHLKSRCQVIANLENIDKEVAQRIIDFISGACYALDGNVQKISDGVFLFAPHNVDITSEMNRHNWKQSSLPWMG